MMQQSTRARVEAIACLLGDGFASSITQALAVSNTTVEACRVLISHPFGGAEVLEGYQKHLMSPVTFFWTGPSEGGQSAGVSAQQKRGFSQRFKRLEASSLN